MSRQTFTVAIYMVYKWTNQFTYRIWQLLLRANYQPSIHSTQ